MTASSPPPSSSTITRPAIPGMGGSVQPVPRPPRRARKILLTTLGLAIIVFALWSTISVKYSYSSGVRTGYVQRLSREGWLCKTWEGELATYPVPGLAPQRFPFTVRSDSIAQIIQAATGKRIALTYGEHRGVPTNCFGETNEYVTEARLAP